MLHRDIFTVEGILKPFGCHGYLLKEVLYKLLWTYGGSVHICVRGWLSGKINLYLTIISAISSADLNRS